jgi:hypothetical protein
MTLDTNTFVIIASALVGIIVIVLIVIVVRMQSKLNRLLGGSTTAKDIESSLAGIASSLTEFERFRTELEKYLTTVESRLKKSVQSVHTVRFNPFKGTGSGGNQSFATAFVNQEGDGVILSSLYSREHVSIFSKPIKAGKAEFELSEEETAALAEARSKLEK